MSYRYVLCFRSSEILHLNDEVYMYKCHIYFVPVCVQWPEGENLHYDFGMMFNP